MNKENLGLSTEDCQKFQEIFKALEEGKEIEFLHSCEDFWIGKFGVIGTQYKSKQFRVKPEVKYSYFASYEDSDNNVKVTPNLRNAYSLEYFITTGMQIEQIKRVIKKYKLNEQTGEIV